MIVKTKNYMGRVIGYAKSLRNEVLIMQTKSDKFTAVYNEKIIVEDIPFDKYTPMEISHILLLGFLYAKDKNWYSEPDKDLIKNVKPEECHFIKPEYYKVNI